MYTLTFKKDDISDTRFAILHQCLVFGSLKEGMKSIEDHYTATNLAKKFRGVSTAIKDDNDNPVFYPRTAVEARQLKAPGKINLDPSEFKMLEQLVLIAF
jgi:hypothetical protein